MNGQKYTIEDVQEFIVRNEWICLSKTYVDCKTKLEFKCKNNHIWKARFDNVKSGRKCPHCNTDSKKVGLAKMQELAELKGGKCLSKEYKNRTTNLKWQCGKNHIWEELPRNILKGSWCLICDEKYKKGRRLTIEQMQELAFKNNGRCLSESYKDNSAPLTWECENGHIWNATVVSAKNSWCLKCKPAHLAINNMEKLNDLAKNNNCKCLSPKYIDEKVKLEWKCDCGYIWKATPRNVKRGYWCPKCNPKNTNKHSFEYIEKKVEDSGFKLLSKEYIDCETRLEFQCKLGHIWKAPFKSLSAGCQHCNKTARNTIEDVHALIKLKNGKCLSTAYTYKEKMKFQCHNGHIWETKFNHIKNDKSWCPHCLTRGEELVRKSFEEFFNKSFPSCKPKFLKYKNNRCLQLDGFNEELKIAFEYQGYQHYTFPNIFHKTIDDYNKQVIHDEFKLNKCKENDINLITINEFKILDYIEIKSYIHNKLKILFEITL